MLLSALPSHRQEETEAKKVKYVTELGFTPSCPAPFSQPLSHPACHPSIVTVTLGKGRKGQHTEFLLGAWPSAEFLKFHALLSFFIMHFMPSRQILGN